MFLGFHWRSRGRSIAKTSLRHGTMYQVDHYRLEYTGERMEVDLTKRMIFADVAVTDLKLRRGAGDGLAGEVHPYKKHA